MSLSVRVIACLDVDNGRVVKGVNFADLVDAGDPVELAAYYDLQGVDELTFLDVTASSNDRETVYEVVRRTAESVFIPLTVGGGIRQVSDIDTLLRVGADKVSINTAAINDPNLITLASRQFGAQCVVISCDVRRVAHHISGVPSGFELTTHGGRRSTGIDALEWAEKVQNLGAGEILLNSMDNDGTQKGFDLELISAIRQRTSLPLIASGGAGKPEHFPKAIEAGADAVLAASVLHFNMFTVGDIKSALSTNNHPVR